MAGNGIAPPRLRGCLRNRKTKITAIRERASGGRTALRVGT